MSLRLGIGIVTYNRRALVAETVTRVLAHTIHPFALVVADDGSEDGTAEAERARGVTVASGRNMGIAWNKNRALFYLIALARCDVAILLEERGARVEVSRGKALPYAGLRVTRVMPAP